MGPTTEGEITDEGRKEKQGKKKKRMKLKGVRYKEKISLRHTKGGKKQAAALLVCTIYPSRTLWEGRRQEGGCKTHFNRAAVSSLL